MKGIYITASAHQFMYWGKAGFYATVEEQYRYQGINIDIVYADIVPLDFEGEEIRFLVTPIQYEYVGYTDRQLVHSDIDD